VERKPSELGIARGAEVERIGDRCSLGLLQKYFSPKRVVAEIELRLGEAFTWRTPSELRIAVPLVSFTSFFSSIRSRLGARWR
jgi:hypothetical protein